MASSNGNRQLRLIVVDSDRGSRLYIKRRLNGNGIRVIGEADKAFVTSFPIRESY